MTLCWVCCQLTKAEKHEIWYKVKTLSVNEFVNVVNMWLTNCGVSADVDENEIELPPHDTVSNVASNMSRKSSSCRSSWAPPVDWAPESFPLFAPLCAALHNALLYL